MKLAFISNYFNYHQKSLSDSFNDLCDEYKFISTQKMDKSRINMGWDKEKPSYVISYDDNITFCESILLKYDIVIYGSSPYKYIKARLESGKITFLYSERIFKDKKNSFKNFIRSIKYKYRFKKYSNIYLLAASGYAAQDYASIGCFKGKALKWGYFPETRFYENVSELIRGKTPNTILWCGRFLDWKHPEMCIRLAENLRSQHKPFNITMVGVGKIKDSIVNEIERNKLQDVLKVLNPMTPYEIRSLMEQSQIYIFTSDRHEGWGAVLNEAMNSCCSVVASSDIGSTPFLIEKGENGFLYDCKDATDLEKYVSILLENEDCRYETGYKAYRTIVKLWNAEIAAERFIKISNKLLDSGKLSFEIEGPCSKA